MAFDWGNGTVSPKARDLNVEAGGWVRHVPFLLLGLVPPLLGTSHFPEAMGQEDVGKGVSCWISGSRHDLSVLGVQGSLSPGNPLHSGLRSITHQCCDNAHVNQRL